EARRELDRRDLVLAKFFREREGHAYGRDLDEVVEEVAAVVESVAVRNLHDEALFALDHQRHAVTTCDDVRAHAALDHRQPLFERRLPEWLVRPAQPVAAPHVVDEYVETALLLPDPLEE